MSVQTSLMRPDIPLSARSFRPPPAQGPLAIGKPDRVLLLVTHNQVVISSMSRLIQLFSDLFLSFAQL
jgi:hypothetical protein